MEIRGNSPFNPYDPGHIRQVQRDQAKSVKPNVLKDLEQEQDLSPEQLLKLLTQDEVELSEEALALLKKLKKRRKKDDDQDEGRRPADPDYEELLAQLQENLTPEAEPLLKLEATPVFPPAIQLSGPTPIASPKSNRSKNSLEPEGQAEQLAHKLLARAPNKDLRKRFYQELSAFGADILRFVFNFGVRAIILDRSTPLTELKIAGMYVVGKGEKTFDGRPWSQVRGIYDSSRRLFVVGEELLSRENRSVIHHEFAHAYDDAYSKKHRRKLPLSVELWNKFAPRRTALVSDYASTNPAEYFAESVEAFFRPKDRELLQKADPGMHQYLTELLNSAYSQ